MAKKRIVRPIIQGRLIYIYNPDPIKFFFLHKPEGLLIANFRFKVSYSRCNSKNLNKLHILIRSPLFCVDRNNAGTMIGNKHQLFFVKQRTAREQPEQQWIPVKERLPEDGVYVLICDGEHFKDYDCKNGAYSQIAVGWTEHGEFRCWDDRTHMSKVIAWMPLPEPYTKDGDSE